MSKPRGRPKIKIDADEVYKLAEIGCRLIEIAEWFGVSEDTIQRNFAAEIAKGRSNLRKSLRRWQLDAARKGNVTMLIWLGKQMLKQAEPEQLTEDNEQEISSQAKELATEELLKLAEQAKN